MTVKEYLQQTMTEKDIMLTYKETILALHSKAHLLRVADQRFWKDMEVSEIIATNQAMVLKLGEKRC